MPRPVEQPTKFVIITSIYPPSAAVKKFAGWKGWETVVVGDRKSPKDWEQHGATFLSIDDQIARFPEMAGHIPENTYTRKMLGYLYAIGKGATAIFESDDDNIPYDDAQATVERMIDESAHPEHRLLRSGQGWVNIYDAFGSTDCWPRGYPLHLIKANPHELVEADRPLKRKVVQFLADEDPDVDAVYRTVHGKPVTFSRGRFLALEPGSYSPFNSQATLWLPEAFPLLYFPLGVPDRVTDILRGYIALAALWKQGGTLAFHSPVVYQERNPHNLHNDFIQETMLYHHAPAWAQKLQELDGSTAGEVYAAAIEHLIEREHLSELNRRAYRTFLTSIDSITSANS